MNPGPLTFTAANIPLVMDGSKTNTRRIMRVQPVGLLKKTLYTSDSPRAYWRDEDDKVFKPPHQPGDIVYAAEGYQIDSDFGYLINYERTVAGIYTADQATFLHQLTDHEWKLFTNRKKPHGKTNGRFMYKSLARSWYKILDVRAERIQDISEGDIWQEGFDIRPEFAKDLGLDGTEKYAYDWFKNLWNSIHGPDGWKDNRWVWVKTLKRVEKPEE